MWVWGRCPRGDGESAGLGSSLEKMGPGDGWLDTVFLVRGCCRSLVGLGLGSKVLDFVGDDIVGVGLAIGWWEIGDGGCLLCRTLRKDFMKY